MKLLIDIGNARIKWALTKDSQLDSVSALRHSGRLRHAMVEFGQTLPSGIEAAKVVSVGGIEIAVELRKLLQQKFAIEPEFVSARSQAHGLRCAYSDPSKLGADRWVAMIGARATVRDTNGPICVIDAGTAVTFDAIDGIGHHLGGLIMPGPAMIAKMLDMSTSGIGPTAISNALPSGLEILGNNTTDAVGHGAWLAIAAGLDRAVDLVADGLGSRPVVFLTGGDAARLQRWMKAKGRLRPELVLEGLAQMARNR